MFVRSALKEAALVAFDIDGTITDAEEHLKKTDFYVQHYVERKYPDIDSSDVSCVTQKLEEFLINNPKQTSSLGQLRLQYYHRLGSKYNFPQSFGDELYSVWQDQRNRYCVYPCVETLFRQIKHNKSKLVIITDGTANFANHPTLDCLVDLFVSPQTYGVTKGTGEAYNCVVDNYPSISVSSCIMIGDNSISDIERAHEKGWKTIFVSPTKENSVADWTISSVCELVEYYVCNKHS